MPGIFAAIKVWISNLARMGRSALGREQEMVRIRLRRQGKKGQPSYRIVVIDQRKARNGKYLENIGHYNPRTRPTTEIIKEDRALYWLSVGAQPSDAVRRIMDHTGTWERFRRFRDGESMEDLVKEAEDNQAELPSPRTTYPAPGDGKNRNHEHKAARSDSKSSVKDKDEDEQNRQADRPLAKDHDTSDLVDAVVGTFNRPGNTQLNNPNPPANPVKRPELRIERKKEGISENITPNPKKNEKKWRVSLKRERRDPATKNFLKEEYRGCCQICGFTFPKRNGEPHFVAAYIIDFEILDDSANVLCLCPNHFAMFKHGAIEAPDIIDKIKSYKGGPRHSVKVQLIENEEEICFTDRHIIDLIAFLETIGRSHNNPIETDV